LPALKPEIATFLAMTSKDERSAAISLFVSACPETRDRFVPRDDKQRRACDAISHFLSLRAQRGNLAFGLLPALKRRDRFVPRDDKQRRAQRGNLSFGCLSALKRRDRHVPRDDKPRRACEAISHFLSLRAQRGNLSFCFGPH